jgi:hypothetical protein
MKQTPAMDKIQRQMRPGVITRDGFLGRDGRKLADILEADNAEVNRLGLTHEGIAARMRELRDAGKKGIGLTTRIDRDFEVQVDSVRGKLPCPFGHAGLVQKMNTTVRNLANGREITYTDLNIHMIGEHGFYEGRGSGFRLEPADLKEILVVRESPPPPTPGMPSDLR